MALYRRMRLHKKESGRAAAIADGIVKFPWHRAPTALPQAGAAAQAGTWFDVNAGIILLIQKSASAFIANTVRAASYRSSRRMTLGKMI
ncbi:hypothetical protein [Labrys monachus]|uniref:Uncharacterized protein n=1 Tax=Labrys monachus TaxID=217067 RepID=A0ABU0FJK0_9HYPH|nr:hypothetical protein [Labrys monachus]MDQ0394263.1 hypothetical protein [Labrys monachus]